MLSIDGPPEHAAIGVVTEDHDGIPIVFFRANAERIHDRAMPVDRCG
jgi:hypothetical protein